MTALHLYTHASYNCFDWVIFDHAVGLVSRHSIYAKFLFSGRSLAHQQELPLVVDGTPPIVIMMQEMISAEDPIHTCKTSCHLANG